MSSSYTLPPPSTIPSLPPQSQSTLLSKLFEPSPSLSTLLLPILSSQHFTTYTDLITTCRLEFLRLLHSSSKPDQEVLLDILSSHPRLGAKKVDSEQSVEEQKSLQSEDGGEEEGEKLRVLNEEYERKFVGMRYVVFVAGRPRSVIMQNMRERIDRGDIEAEKLEAINAMCDIANDRAGKLQAKI